MKEVTEKKTAQIPANMCEEDEAKGVGQRDTEEHA